MKKFLSLLTLALLLTFSGYAQGLRYGLTGAMNLSRYAISIDGVEYSPENRIAFKAGFRMELDASFIAEGFYMDMEALISSRGAKLTSWIDQTKVQSTIRPYYIELPLHIGYQMQLSRNLDFFTSFGPYFSIGIFGDDEVKYDGKTYKPESFRDGALRRFDFGVGIKGGFEMFDHYRLYFGYDWGLINAQKDSDGAKSFNRNFFVGAAYMF